MSSDHNDPAYRRSVSYIDKTRDYYRALGYEAPYRWASNTETPFTAPSKPLNRSTVALVTTSFLPRKSLLTTPGDPPLQKEAYHAPSWPAPEAMFTADLSWHQEATHTDDVESFLPLTRLREMADDGRIGAISPRFYGVPTQYSQRQTAADAQQVGQWCTEDDVDVVLLVPL